MQKCQTQETISLISVKQISLILTGDNVSHTALLSMCLTFASNRQVHYSMLLPQICINRNVNSWVLYTGGNQIIMEIQYQASDSLW